MEASQAVASQPQEKSLWGSVKPYFEKESLAALFVGISSGFPFALLASRRAGKSWESSSL